MKDFLFGFILFMVLMTLGCDRLKQSNALIDAIRAKDLAKTTELLKNGDNPNATMRDGTTPLIAAAATGKLEFIQLLVEQGATVNVKDDANKSPLVYAAYHGGFPEVHYLLEKGGNLQELLQSDFFEPEQSYCATGKSNLDELDYYFSKGFPVNHKNHWGMTALHCAARRNILDFVKFLLAKGADAQAKDEKGKTPLHYAVEADPISEELVTALIVGGADFNTKDQDGHTPFYYIDQEKSPEITKFFLSNGAIPEDAEKEEASK